MLKFRSAAMTCPYCHQDAPPIVRGFRAYCTACGSPRSIVTAAAAVNVAGQPARLGGDIAHALGWLALAGGLAFALVLGAIAYFLFALTAALWVGGLIAFGALAVSLPFILGGRRLHQAGEDRVHAAQEHAAFALAARRRGVLTAREVARSCALREEEADALLTDLARRQDGRVTLEVDDDGGLSYVFHDLLPTAPRVRVAPVPWPTRVIDAELIDDEVVAGAVAPPAVRQAVR
jgi:hypothetical protein